MPTLVELLRTIGATDYVVVGRIAVRLLAGDRTARETRDIDIVTLNEVARDRLLAQLRGTGYHIGMSAG